MPLFFFLLRYRSRGRDCFRITTSKRCLLVLLVVSHKILHRMKILICMLTHIKTAKMFHINLSYTKYVSKILVITKTKTLFRDSFQIQWNLYNWNEKGLIFFLSPKFLFIFIFLYIIYFLSLFIYPVSQIDRLTWQLSYL